MNHLLMSQLEELRDRPGILSYHVISAVADQAIHAIPRWSTDMDAAPDGQRVLLWEGAMKLELVGIKYDGIWTTFGGFEVFPTHWMPITPPEGE